MADTPVPLRALLTGAVTPDKRAAIISWLGSILNPSGSAPSPIRRTRQVLPAWGLLGGRNPTADLALQLLGDQYPDASAQSPTASVLPLWPWMRGRRFEGSGHMQFRAGRVPQDDDDPEVWSRKFLELLDTGRHELSHGMGVPDNYGGWRGLSAQDVSDASARLHGDIHLPGS